MPGGRGSDARAGLPSCFTPALLATGVAMHTGRAYKHSKGATPSSTMVYIYVGIMLALLNAIICVAVAAYTGSSLERSYPRMILRCIAGFVLGCAAFALIQIAPGLRRTGISGDPLLSCLWASSPWAPISCWALPLS